MRRNQQSLIKLTDKEIEVYKNYAPKFGMKILVVFDDGHIKVTEVDNSASLYGTQEGKDFRYYWPEFQGEILTGFASPN